jgi:hypothetical protein
LLPGIEYIPLTLDPDSAKISVQAVEALPQGGI